MKSTMTFDQLSPRAKNMVKEFAKYYGSFFEYVSNLSQTKKAFDEICNNVSASCSMIRNFYGTAHTIAFELQEEVFEFRNDLSAAVSFLNNASPKELKEIL